jgi:hypothetical protein
VNFGGAVPLEFAVAQTAVAVTQTAGGVVPELGPTPDEALEGLPGAAQQHCERYRLQQAEQQESELQKQPLLVQLP